jgi:hypothetical protein
MKIFGSTIKYIIIISFLSSACSRGMICPAFQSSFILNDSIRDITFSMFGPDSLPREYLTAKSRYGIIEDISYKEKKNSIKTVEMITILDPGPPLDSLLVPQYQEDSLKLADPQLSSVSGK